MCLTTSSLHKYFFFSMIAPERASNLEMVLGSFYIALTPSFITFEICLIE